MHRPLLVVAIVEALVIAVLVVLLASRSGPTVLDATVPAVVPSAAVAAVSAPAPLPSPSRQPLAPPELAEAQLGTLLSGRVVDVLGAPVANASVSLRRPGESRGIGAAVAAGRGYALVGLTPGEWVVRASAERCEAFERQITITGAHQRFDITLQRARVVAVTFLDENGAPAPPRWRTELGLDVLAVSVIATVDEPPAQLGMTTLRELSGIGVGQWRAARRGERADGSVQIGVPGPVWVAAVLRQTIVARRLVLPDEAAIELVTGLSELRAQLATVRLQVVAAETGAPIAGWVVLSDEQSTGESVATDTSGNVTLENVVPGLLQCSIHADGRAGSFRYLRVEAGARIDLGRVGLDRPRTIAGVVRTVDGEPAAGVVLSCYRLDDGSPDLPLASSNAARADGAGVFEVLVGAGRYLLRGRLEGAIAEACADTSAHDVTELHVRLQEGAPVTIENRVAPIDAFTVRVARPTGETVLGWLEPPNVPERTFLLLPGHYRVEIRRDREVVRYLDLEARHSGTRIVVP